MTRMPPILRTLGALGARDQVLAAIILLALATLLGLAVRAARKTLAKSITAPSAASVLTFVNATLATAVAANGMWQFFGDRLQMDTLTRILFFSVMEVTVLTCATLVRRRIREAVERARELRERYEPVPLFSAGSPGVMIWLVAILSGTLSALGAHSAPERLFRLAPSLIAAWLWEQCLFTDLRHAGLVTKGQLILSRLLVRLGLAEPEQRSASEATALWRLTRLAVAVAHAKRARHFGWLWSWRARSLNVSANQRLGLATSKEHQDTLVALLGSMLGTDTLIALEPPSPWDPAEIRAAWERAQQAVPETAPEPPAGGPEAVPGDDSEPPQDRPEDDPGDGPGDGPGDDRKPSPEAPRKTAAVRLRPGHGKTAEELVPHVLAMIEKYGTVSRDRVKTDLRVGPDKAKAALDLARAKREDTGATVTQLHRDRAAEG